jgi:NADPH:quinone reductase-like Zn-dependent oxidoreductase
MIRSLGADHVIDYTREDFTTCSEKYDLILDVASNLSLKACKGSLTPKGIYVLIGHDHYGKATGHLLGSIPRFFTLLALSPFVRQLPTPNFSPQRKGDAMTVLAEFLEQRKITPVIDRILPLEEVSAALLYLQEGRSCGKIVITP